MKLANRRRHSHRHPGGVGAFRDPKCYPQPGDLIEVEISGVGTLRHPVTGK